MSKLGVEVGEDFPLNEPPPTEQREGCEGATCGGRHAAWHHWRRHMRAEWRDRKRALAEQMFAEWRARRTARDAVLADRPHLPHLVIGALALVGLAAILGHLHNGRN